MKADWEAEQPKRRRGGWKDDLAHADQHVPARAPTMPKLKFMEGLGPEDPKYDPSERSR